VSEGCLAGSVPFAAKTLFATSNALINMVFNFIIVMIATL